MSTRKTPRTGPRSARSEPAGRIRIIGGRLRGRLLDVPAGADLRPTPNRVRETLFNWLQGEIEGARCLDLFAGTGALGIEALSRGAAAVTFVEADARVAAKLREQLTGFGVEAEVICTRAERYLQAADEPFDVVFADPPFSVDATPVCAAIEPLLRARGVLYCERDGDEDLPALKWGTWESHRRAAKVRFGIARRSVDEAARMREVSY